MSTDSIRRASSSDLPALNAIYNHYVVHTATTFDTEIWSEARRMQWLTQFSERGRHQLFVAEHRGRVVGFAGTTRFRQKAAYDSTVETTIYLDPDATGAGHGPRLYEALFASLEGARVHRAIAGLTLPNDASSRLHRRFGFESCGVMAEVGHKFGRYWDVEWLQRSM